MDLPARGRRVVTLNARRIPGDQERGHLVLLAIDDVTERANVAEDLLVNSRRKDDFLAMLAHELRHPLTPITHAIHLLRLTEVDPATAASYEVIETQTRRLAKFVDELGDIVRVDRVFWRSRGNVSISWMSPGRRRPRSGRSWSCAGIRSRARSPISPSSSMAIRTD